MRQKIIIAIDSFKGCLTSQEANQAAAEGVTACVPDLKGDSDSRQRRR